MKNFFIGICIILGMIILTKVVKRKESPPMNEDRKILDLNLPESRSFYMGMTPMPYDRSVQAVRDTYKMINSHTDIIAHHLDSGIPWPEALANKRYHPKVNGNIRFRMKQLRPGGKVYLAVTPIALWRDRLTGYWGKNEHMKRPSGWENKDFDDPDIIAAYINFCRHMIKEFNPAYMAYGVEVNILAKKNPEAFQKYLIMTEQVYTTLKKEYPELPLFLTFHIDSFFEDKKQQRKAISSLVPFTDYVAVSTYPHQVKADPENLPRDWFSEMHRLAPDKKFAVAETGFIAEDLVLSKYKVKISGNARWQEQYVQFLLEQANDLDAEFVIWFVPKDYDLVWQKFEKEGRDEFFKLWRDTGLIDGVGVERKSLDRWDAWLSLSRN